MRNAYLDLTNSKSSTKPQIPASALILTPIVQVPPVTWILSMVGCVHFCQPLFVTSAVEVLPSHVTRSCSGFSPPKPWNQALNLYVPAPRPVMV